MNRFNYEAKYVEEGLEQFKPFLLSTEIFWNINLKRPANHAPYPQLTLGNMLLSIHILNTDDVADEYKEIIHSFDAIKQEWMRAWQKKAELEFNFRIKQWGRYLVNLQGEQAQSAASFKNDVRIRVLLELLQGQMKAQGENVADDLNALDLQFHRQMKADDFVWPLEIKASFASEDYWFLYCSPKQ